MVLPGFDSPERSESQKTEQVRDRHLRNGQTYSPVGLGIMVAHDRKQSPTGGREPPGKQAAESVSKVSAGGSQPP